MTPENLMSLAIEAAQRGIAAGQSPFGCAIARGDRVVAACHNQVWSNTDITAHAEITAIRQACQQVSSILLDDCIVASTCEPCPMCMSALHWARVKSVYFGATIDDARLAGFNELTIAARDIVSQGGSSVELVGGVMATQCAEVFQIWKDSSRGRAY